MSHPLNGIQMATLREQGDKEIIIPASRLVATVDDARRAALESVRVAVYALRFHEGGHPTGYWLATRDDEELAPDALELKRLWQAVDRALLDDAGRETPCKACGGKGFNTYWGTTYEHCPECQP